MGENGLLNGAGFDVLSRRIVLDLLGSVIKTELWVVFWVSCNKVVREY
jgi:hypothetical protein